MSRICDYCGEMKDQGPEAHTLGWCVSILDRKLKAANLQVQKEHSDYLQEHHAHYSEAALHEDTKKKLASALLENEGYRKALEKISGEVLLQAEARKIAFDALGWVTARCTSAACRGRRKGGEGFEVTVRRGQEKTAMCNECFCR